MLRFTRTFHPVGQGAFYTEEIKLNEHRTFRMVYDCGSTSLSLSDFKKRIKSDLAGNTKVDILFISHFDQDHTNGVRNLEPQTVVIPFLSEEQIFLLNLHNKIFGETYDVKLAENPADIFPQARIIRVSPEDPESNRPISNRNEIITIDINDDAFGQRESNILSRSVIQISDDDNPIWEYILYNPTWNKYADRFRAAAEREGLEWDTLINPSNGDYIKKYFSVLNEIYNYLKPKNEHSLVVYSNATTDEWISHRWFRNYMPIHHLRHLYFHRHRTPSGCIYFGDATITHQWKSLFYQHLHDTYRLHRIGTLQVPHHGAYSSKGQDILSPKYRWPVLCIISVGERNHFGHPSAHVVQELQDRGGDVILVTEESSSLFYSKGYIDI